METERLIIDQIRPEDHLDYYTNISHDRRVLETFICAYAESPDDLDISRYVGRDDILAIRLRETGKLIGILSIFAQKDDGSCEIGYGLGSRYWNCGYASEAVKRLIEHLFTDRNMKKIYASFFTGNDSSRRVMEKCGMTFSHFSPGELVYQGRKRDLTYYCISR
ncbi:MAG: GNAT family N-acetyltransferase [Erysipelotrichaceae bacterium]|nr:GNAT family N-acetyltransferase [Erysipelotrichaceae bacterium]